VRFSVFNLARQALSAHRNWPEQWRSPEPKNAYDAIIIGAGGHGLGTAYYLAKEHGMRNIAVLEKGWLRQYGTQYDDHPVELSVGRKPGALRTRGEALGKSVAGAEL
jgi:choline dehydrogenase-like flavoprotein